ncbi:MAG: hypothetical protein M9894_13155 [Planctomycetes bacterium]|nr:hypothetical protein [Planctomycetota bacterium]
MSTARPGVQHPRCPFCHEAVRPDHTKAACDGCMAWQHGACWDDHGRCAACEAPRKLFLAGAAVRRRSWAPAAFVAAAALGALLGASLGGLAGDGGARGPALAMGGMLGFIVGAALVSLVGESRAARVTAAALDVEDPPELDAWAVARETERAERGDPRAMRRVGEAHLRGVGAPKDEGAALGWFRRGAERGDLSCALACVRLLERRPGTKDLPRPREEAVRWARQAAEAGSVDAMMRLGLLLVDRSVAGADPREGARWLREAAERGERTAAVSFAWCLERGLGAPSDEREALSWYRRAATGGSAAAMVHLAALLERGVDGPPDLTAAAAWYRRAAALRQPLAEAACDDLDDAADRLDDDALPPLAAADRARELEEHRLDQAHVHVVRAQAALADGDLVVADRQALLALGLLGDGAPDAHALRAAVAEARGDLEGALAGRRRVAELRPEQGWSWLHQARLEALLGRRDVALDLLARGAACGDEPEPVWLRLWRVGLGAPPDELEADAAEEGAWTARLARLVQRRADPDALLLEATRDGPPGQRPDDARCEVLGFAGLLADVDGDLEAARARYEACVATDAADFVEHEWARLRLAQLDRAGAAAPSLRDLFGAGSGRG